ncbi:hypothetical protein M422DRAFT_275317 [Sphaerobolus stellatus SS14]|uniref:CHAT domain-containing protein n=1 Tax=Sphaerobolus stellatus (strain SS14) TaxID=990650 RepID=A0A0C9UEX1_SPHS4|nr:hypothetical protein M422DRAFT_275317 [Sphaerobolus stellatus SS14]
MSTSLRNTLDLKQKDDPIGQVGELLANSTLEQLEEDRPGDKSPSHSQDGCDHQSSANAIPHEQLMGSIVENTTFPASIGLLPLKQLDYSEEFQYLNKKITDLERKISSINDHVAKAGYFKDLGDLFCSRFDRLGHVVDIDQAIAAQQEAVNLTNDDHPDKARYLNNLEISCCNRLSYLQEGINMTSHNPPAKAALLNNLGISFRARFDKLGMDDDISEAIRVHQQAVTLIPDGHADKLSLLNNLGNSFRSRWETLGGISDIDQGIVAHQEACNLTPDGHVEKPHYLTNIGTWYSDRFEQLGNLIDINKAINAQQEVVKLVPDSHAAKAGYLDILAGSLLSRFRKLGDIIDIDMAIAAQQEAINLTPNDNADKAQYMANLGECFLDRFRKLGEPLDIDNAIATLQFQKFGDIADNDKAIAAQYQVINMTPDADAHKAQYMANLGECFHSRFVQHGADRIISLDNAISAQQEAINIIANDHPSRPDHLQNLGHSHFCRFVHLKDPIDLHKAITILQEAINLTPDGHTSRSICLNNLGNCFRLLFKQLRKVIDIDKAIEAGQEAVNITTDGDVDKAEYLCNLGSSLSSLFGHFGDLADIEKAVIVGQEAHLGELADIDKAISAHLKAIALTPNGSSYKSNMLNNLGAAFHCQFEQSGNLTDIDKAIIAGTDSVNLTPDGYVMKAGSIVSGKEAVNLTDNNHTNKADSLNNLGTSLLSRFEHLGEIKDLDKAIIAHQKAITLTPDGNTHKPNMLNSLGNALHSRFKQGENLTDIDKAIIAGQDAVNLTTDGQVAKSIYLNDLGRFFASRFERLGRITDIEKAIVAGKEAINLIPDGHTSQASLLTNLARSYSYRFFQLGDLVDIDKAISLNQKVVNLTPNEHTTKPKYLNNLGATDSDNAIAAQQEAVKLIPDDHTAKPNYLRSLGRSFPGQKAVNLIPDSHPNKAGSLSTLGNSFLSRVELLHELPDIDNTIAAHQKAVDLTPDDHIAKGGYLIISLTPEKHAIMAQCLGHLGASLELRYKRLGKLADRDSAISAYCGAAKNNSSNPSIQYHAAKSWASLSSDSGLISSALEAYTVLLEILPQHVWLGQKVNHRYDELSRIGSVINAAAALAISIGNLILALEWLEEGQSIVWGQILQLRTPIDELHLKYPEYADNSQIYQLTIEEEAHTHHTLAAEYAQLIEQIGTLDGFMDFLKPKKLTELIHACKNGPVVVINVYKSRCDALVLHPFDLSEPIIHVPLPHFSPEKAFQLHSHMNSILKMHHVCDTRKLVQDQDAALNSAPKLQDILHNLWLWIVEPVILAIQSVLEHSADDYMHHITWCATGLLALLPLHAAGEYHLGDMSKKRNMFDIAVSSYTPTLTSLLPHLKKSVRSSNASHGVLIVSQPSTPGQLSIQGTIREAEAIQNIFKPIPTWSILHITDEEVTVERISQEIARNNWVHLSCHGIQDAKNAVKSAFALHNGKLHLETLMSTSLENAQFAFISACQTATGDEKLPDEAVHLAAGMLAVGFPSVVATMWSVRDNDAPIVAEAFYSILLNNSQTLEGSNGQLRAAYALHEAVKELREKVGENNFIKWVPFVHFGL